MKIRSIEALPCDAAWRSYNFLKITTDDGLVGWSEYSEGWGFGGVTPVIETLALHLVGQDPLAWGRVAVQLHQMTRASRGGIAHGAVAAIENALLDIRAKSLGIPVYALFGGPMRTKLPCYWTHCGTYRARHAEELGVAPLRSIDDFVALGREVRQRGFRAMKTNTLPFDGERFHSFAPGTARTPGWPELNYRPDIVDGLKDQLAALREGAGADAQIMLDLNYSYKVEGFIKVSRALEDANLEWLELDVHDWETLAAIRSEAPMPIASCEHLFGRRDFRPFLENRAMDVAIIDVLWNGVGESMKIASMAEPYEVNVAPHNYYGPLADLMAAHFCAAVPNFRIMEMDVDTVPWQHELINFKPVVEDGQYLVPDAPGWGVEVNEEMVRRHTPRSREEYRRLRFAGLEQPGAGRP